VFGILRINPDRPAITIIKKLTGFASIARTIKAAPGRRVDKRSSPVDEMGRGGMDLKRVNVWINKWLGRTFEIRFPVTALG
jgi:hypothetical protein